MHLPMAQKWRGHSAERLTLILAIILVVNLFLLTDFAETLPHHRSYSLKKGSLLERHHRRSMHDWRRAYRHLTKKSRHHKRKPRIHRVMLDEIVNQMDSIMRPRFGRR